jgi:glycosyltransferase involved in cell wall biosynthesis
MQCIQEHGSRPILICPDGALYRKAVDLNIIAHQLEFPNVHRIAGFIPIFSFQTVLQIYKIILKYNSDIFHAESLLSLYYGGLSARFAGIPCVATYHGYWKMDSKITRQYIHHFCNRIYPVSNIIAHDVNSFFDHPTKRSRVIPLSINQDFLAELPSKKIARNLLNLPDGRPIVMQVARFQEIKGQANLLDALEMILHRPNATKPLIIFVGDLIEPVTKGALSYKSNIEKKAKSREFIDHVMLLGNREDIPLLMRAADIIVNPSDFETFSMAIIEAMAVGTPVISTSVGGPIEIIEDHVNGILVPPKDPIALGNSIISLLDNEKLREELSTRAKEIVIKRYGPVVRCECLISEYSDLIGSKK